MLERLLTKKLKKHSKSFLLLGPRQTGKSTLIRELRPSLEINLADEGTFVRYASNPELIKSTIHNHKTVFIDEVQRLPSLLNTLQTILDSPSSPRFFLTGSSARKLRRGKANLLPGRIVSYELGPLSLSELGSQFDIHKALVRGLLPGVYLEPDDSIWKKVLRAYSIQYLKEEIQAEALTRNLEGFYRFFDIITSRNGDITDFSKISREAQVQRVSVQRYFEILTDTLIFQAIPAFTKSQRTRLRQHPRFYLFDVGVFNGIMNSFDAPKDRLGVLYENLFLQCLLSQMKGKDEEVRVSFYRTESGAEVDFIIETKHDLFAIEVKASKSIHPADLSGLKSFENFYGKKCECLVFAPNAPTMTLDGIKVLPLPQALQYFD